MIGFQDAMWQDVANAILRNDYDMITKLSKSVEIRLKSYEGDQNINSDVIVSIKKLAKVIDILDDQL